MMSPLSRFAAPRETRSEALSKNQASGCISESLGRLLSEDAASSLTGYHMFISAERPPCGGLGM
jgi:hypothetical protein